MIRYIVKGTVPGTGRVQHVIKAASPKEAKERFLRAQGPNCTDIAVKKP